MCNVLCKFSPPHELGAHTGQSRIIRKAYFEQPSYVPLLQRAYEGWKILEGETATTLFYRTGLVYFGPPEGTLIKGVANSADRFP